MIAKHEFTFHCECPVDGAVDEYSATVTTSKLLRVESILEAINAIDGPQFQEALTVDLARKFDAHVKTVGYHSGVKTTCEAGLLL